MLNRPGMSGQFSCWKDGVMASTSKRYPAELKDRVVRMVAEIRSEHGSEWAAVESVAEKLGIGTAQKVQNWVRRAQVDAGQRSGMTVGQLSQGGVVADLPVS